MICSKERDKNNWYWKLCMQWTELAVIGYTTTPQPTYFFLFFSDKHYIYGKNKKGSTFDKFTLFRNEKGRNLSKPVGLGVAVLFLEYISVFRERKD